MTEETQKPELDTGEVTKAGIKNNLSLNHVWWIPIIAFIAVIYLATKHFASQGPLITLHFATAEGMVINKTQLRYKNVVIGQVEKIKLDDEYKNIIVSVRVNKDSEGLLRQNTQFWVVKPRISVAGVSGLGTLLSGAYITLDPDKNMEHDFRNEFEGLATPPIVPQDKPGLRLTLLTEKASSLIPGTAVYYKGLKVGSVDRVYFSKDYLWVKADIFIASPHDLLIKQTTKFWSASGISIKAGTAGVDVEMESVEALVAGGIVFETPVTLQKQVKVNNSAEYVLYSNRKQAFEQNYGKKRYYVTYFNSSVKGLQTGSPVMIQGIEVGRVKDIQLAFDKQTGKTHIPVLFEVYDNRLGIANSVALGSKEKMNTTVSQQLLAGLQTRMETANLLTGAKYISLVLGDQHVFKQQILKTDPVTGYPILPSTPESFDAITSGVSRLITKLNQLPLNKIASNIDTLLKNANDKVNAIDIGNTLAALTQLLKGGQVLAKDASKTLKKFNNSVTTLTKVAEKTLSGLSPDAPLYYNLNNTLNGLNETLGSLKAITDMLDRTPNALIFGEDRSDEK
ncbi:MAG: PqiB family protein [Ostreibacterium sp.]